jgi:hypothetical protein
MTILDVAAQLAAMPEALTHPYATADDQRSILLYRGPARWQSKHVDTRLTDSLVYVDLLPTPHLLVDALLPAAQAFGDWFSPRHSVKLPPTAHVPQSPDRRLRTPEEGEGSVSQRAPFRGIDIGVRRRTRSVRFLVLNYHDVNGSPVRFPDGSTTAGRVQITADGWRLILDPVHPRRDIFNRLREDGGIAVTQVGELSRMDGDDFDPRDALDVLECFHYLLWFSRGTSCAVLLPVGFDRHGNAIWSHWQEAWVERFTTLPSWFDYRLRAGTQLGDLFPLFLSLWRNPCYNSALRIALRNYLDANDPKPIESSIALAQLALESLAYAHLIIAGHDPSAWGRYVHANVTLRRLLQLLHVPIRIPNQVRSLRHLRPARWSVQDPWDGPSAVTFLRNDAMHGERGSPRPTGRNWFDGWQLGCWYVEMTVLALCGYRGTYVSRLSSDSLRATVHRVPWARGA